MVHVQAQAKSFKACPTVRHKKRQLFTVGIRMFNG